MSFVKNSVEPKPTVINLDTISQNNLFIDFCFFPKWMHSTTVKTPNGNNKNSKKKLNNNNKDFTNRYSNEKEFAKKIYEVNSKLFPYIQQNIELIFAHKAKHCHTLDAKISETARKVIFNIHRRDIDESTELWQLAAGGSTRLICALLSKTDGTVLYPLFIDHHHLLLPDDTGSNNKTDYSKCKFNPQDRYK